MSQATLLSPGSTVPALSVPDSPPTRESLGAHILAEILRCCGPQLPCHSAEQILDGFWDRFGPAGMTICDQAFKVHNGMWRGAPITILRFQASHDGFFATPLLSEAGASHGTGDE